MLQYCYYKGLRPLGAYTSELEKLEDLILSYKSEQDIKRKHILYLTLIEESLKLVNKIASGIYPLPSSTSKEDLVQVGAVGVLRAIDTYKVEKKGSFKTYVSKFIKGKILHYLRDKANIVRPPRESVENITKVRNAIKDLYPEGTSNPSAEEISSYIKMPVNKVQEILNIELLKNMISLDQNVYSNDGVETLLDRIQQDSEETFEENFANKKMLEFALSKLAEPDKTIVMKYYLHEVTRKSLAQEYKVSTTQISRILKRALHKLYIIIDNEISQKGG